MKTLGLAIGLFVALATTGAQAQINRYTVEYEPSQRVSLSDNPITLSVTNWGTDWASSIWTAKAKGGDEYRNVYYITANINKPGYKGDLLFSETIPDHSWSDDTLRARIQRHSYFSKVEVEFGTYGTVDNGPAEFKYMMLNVTDKGEKLSCAYFRGQWRNRQTIGGLCADSRVPALTEATLQAYIKGIGYKTWLSPSGTVTLPLAGDNRG